LNPLFHHLFLLVCHIFHIIWLTFIITYFALIRNKNSSLYELSNKIQSLFHHILLSKLLEKQKRILFYHKTLYFAKVFVIDLWIFPIKVIFCCANR
jgi:hypothetical protein